MLGKIDVISSAIATASMATTGAVIMATPFVVHPFHAGGAVAGGICGALITAREAFKPSSKVSVGYMALCCATSLFVGATAGFFLPLASGELFRMPIDTASPALWGFSWLIAIFGEQVAGIAMKRVIGGGG